MSPEQILALISGPTGGFVVMALLIYALVTTKFVVPGPIYRASEERNSLLEEEAQATQKLIAQQSEQLSDQRVHAARLEAQVSHLTEQVERLTKEIQSLRGQLGRTS